MDRTPKTALPLRGRAWLYALIAIFILSATLRLAFVGAMLNSGDGGAYVTPDSPGYLRLAGDESAGGAYYDDPGIFRHLRLIRPPGYPTFLYMIRQFNGLPIGALFVQAVIGALIPVGVASLVRLTSSRSILAVGAGVIAAISPTGIAIPAMIMPDLLFAAAFLAGFYLLWLGGANGWRGLTSGSAVLFGVSCFVKPATIMWPLGAVFVWFFASRYSGRQARWSDVGMFLAIQALMLGAWSARNYLAEGTLKFSLIGDLALIDYLGARVEAAMGSETGKTVREIQGRNRDGRRSALVNGQPPADVVQAELRRILSTYRQEPATTIKIYSGNIVEQIYSGWSYFPQQVGHIRAIGDRAPAIRRLEGKARAWCVILGLMSIPIAFVEWLVSRDKESYRRLWASMAFFVAVGYFLAASGVTFWTGSRILYPAEFAVIVLIAFVISTGSRLSGGAFALAKSRWEKCAGIVVSISRRLRRRSACTNLRLHPPSR
jgi:hypothetical protein